MLSGLLYARAQRDSGWWLAFVFLVPLLIALRGQPLTRRVALGGLAGVAAAWFGALATAATGLATFFDRSQLFGVLAGGAIGALTGGVGFALFALGVGDPRRTRPALLCVRAGVAFALGELARAHVVPGLPWLLLGHALAPVPRLAQLAALAGVTGLGVAIAAANGALFAIGWRRDARAVNAIAAIVVALAFTAADSIAPRVAPGAAGSIASVAAGTPPRAGALRVALVQPDTPLAWMHDAGRLDDRLAQLVATTQPALPADLVVWPENAFGAVLPANESRVREAVAQLAPRPALLFGAPRYDRADPTRVFNAVLLWDADGRALGVHDKVQLLPFTEFVPRWLAALGVGGGRTARGDAIAPVDLRGTKIGVLICYEVLFARLAHELVAQGAGVLVNPSNDAWFGASGAGEQMLAAAVLLAIETRTPVLRATPTGTTAAIDARGRVFARLPIDTAGALVVDVIPERRRGE